MTRPTRSITSRTIFPRYAGLLSSTVQCKVDAKVEICDGFCVMLAVHIAPTVVMVSVIVLVHYASTVFGVRLLGGSEACGSKKLRFCLYNNARNELLWIMRDDVAVCSRKALGFIGHIINSGGNTVTT
jgi:hypothetical protein